MEYNRKKQIISQVENAYQVWLKHISVKSNVDNIEQTIEIICSKLAFGTIIVTGSRNPVSYVGTFKQCRDLKQNFGGQVGVISNVWYWIGYAKFDAVREIVKNKQKNLVLSVPPGDIAETTLNVGELASMNIRYGNSKNGRASYVGSYKVCILLRRRYGGKIGKLYNHWYWIGHATFDNISDIYNSYQASAKRFNRKRIILTI